MDPELLALIRAFQASAASALSTVLFGTGLSHPFKHREEGIPSVGRFVDQQSGLPVHYAFHGIGLAVTMGTEHVNFDFGYDGRTTGFNEWWLRGYAEERATRFPRMSRKDELGKALETARNAGRIRRPPASLFDSLEYLEAELPAAAT